MLVERTIDSPELVSLLFKESVFVHGAKTFDRKAAEGVQRLLHELMLVLLICTQMTVFIPPTFDDVGHCSTTHVLLAPQL
jgi:hypothetical protein